MEDTRLTKKFPRNRKLWQTFSILSKKEKEIFQVWLSKELKSPKHKLFLLYQHILQNENIEKIYGLHFFLFQNKEQLSGSGQVFSPRRQTENERSEGE